MLFKLVQTGACYLILLGPAMLSGCGGSSGGSDDAVVTPAVSTPDPSPGPTTPQPNPEPEPDPDPEPDPEPEPDPAPAPEPDPDPEPEPDPDPEPDPEPEKTRIMLLGDSITEAGEGHPGYRRELWFLLQSAGYNIDFVGSHNHFRGSVPEKYFDFDLDNEGHWGREAGWVEDRLAGWLDGYTPDVVLMHLGTNDLYRGQDNASTIAELGNIIDLLRQDNPQVIILMAKLIPMRDTDTAGLNAEIEALAASKQRGSSPIVVVDQYSGYDTYSHSYDNWHPNSAGEEKMADKWFAALRAILPD